MEHARVIPVEPTPGTRIDAAYDNPEYRDAFLIEVGPEVTIEDFATSFFMSQPAWIGWISMQLGSRDARQKATGDGTYAAGSSVGSWTVRERSDDEIVFGDHMGFMEFRFSIFRRPDGHIEAATSVKYIRRFAHIYFGIVKPFHAGFIKIALRSVARHAAASNESQDHPPKEQPQ